MDLVFKYQSFFSANKDKLHLTTSKINHNEDIFQAYNTTVSSVTD